MANSRKRNEMVRLVALGGMDELGKNMWLACIGEDWLLVDAGSAFPENEMLGVDMVIPDISYLLEQPQKLRGIVLSHAHVDHIGALPYLLSQLPLPIYGSALTIEMTKHYLKQHEFEGAVDYNIVEPGKQFKLGSIVCELFRVTHDIPDACGIAIKSSQGWLIFSGDFKIDYTPLDNKLTDLARLSEYGREGVLCLLSDSSNAELKGSTFSESEMGSRLEQALTDAGNRVIIHLGVNDLFRLQQLLWLAANGNWQVQIASPALEEMLAVANRANALLLPPTPKARRERTRSNGQTKQMILTTTAPGEPFLSSLLGVGGGRSLVQKGDTIVLTGAYVPGSEKTQLQVINNLYRQGVARVIEVLSRGAYGSHAAQDELKLILSLTNPKHLIPTHGEVRQLVRHRDLAISLGWPMENVFLPENGTCVDFTNGIGEITESIAVGKLLVDGLGVGDIGGVVLRDRKQLSEDGLVIAVLAISRREDCLVCEPEIVTRGFVYEPESDQLLDEVREKLREHIAQISFRGKIDWAVLKGGVKDLLGKLIFDRTHRRPMILPMILEVRRGK